jgi:hypothetical protein
MCEFCEETQEEPDSSVSFPAHPSEAEIVSYRKIEHFGQVSLQAANIWLNEAAR